MDIPADRFVIPRFRSRPSRARVGLLVCCCALILPLTLTACATSRVTEPDNSPENILGPIDMSGEFASVDEQYAEDEEVAEAPAPVAPKTSKNSKKNQVPTQTISFEGADADPGVADEVSAPPDRPNLPALELFGSGGRGGPG